MKADPSVHWQSHSGQCTGGAIWFGEHFVLLLLSGMALIVSRRSHLYGVLRHLQYLVAPPPSGYATSLLPVLLFLKVGLAKWWCVVVSLLLPNLSGHPCLWFVECWTIRSGWFQGRHDKARFISMTQQGPAAIWLLPLTPAFISSHCT